MKNAPNSNGYRVGDEHPKPVLALVRKSAKVLTFKPRIPSHLIPNLRA